MLSEVDSRNVMTKEWLRSTPPSSFAELGNFKISFLLISGFFKFNYSEAQLK